MVREKGIGYNGKKDMRLLREIVQTLAAALLIYAAIQSSLQTFKVYGASMEPTLEDGQYLLINKAVFLHYKDSYPFSRPGRGEVVVFRPPKSPKVVFIKRVIGLPGETVEVKGGRVWVDGKPLEEPYIQDRPSYVMPPRKIPPGYYFVLGDNRNHSTDSHSWEQVGPVPIANIIGRAWLSFWPADKLGAVANYSFAAQDR